MWTYTPEGCASNARIADNHTSFTFDWPPSDEQGAIMADALNVHTTHGLSPSQLQARIAQLEAWQDDVRSNSPLLARLERAEQSSRELLAALRELRHAFRPSEEDYDPVWYPDIAKADGVLAKHNPCSNG